ncbi:hypothetical protein QTO34_003966 [Cnephaeus nilssonii]|uniref:Phospholipid scramblase n=1 Tax=Cnephaeus nilssonii TaxID=3371016 RepID=A0AA40LLT1_CNENI|nr:hypothetical protein QTO34_003966 [Eptesicus nilssonii]
MPALHQASLSSPHPAQWPGACCQACCPPLATAQGAFWPQILVTSMNCAQGQATEKSNFCACLCCGACQPLHVHLVDPEDREMEVQSPPGTTIGHVLQTRHPFLPKFSIQDADCHTILRVVGPCWTCGFGTDTNFEVKTPDESHSVGHISKQCWGGGGGGGRCCSKKPSWMQMTLVEFPLDLDVRVKAVLRITFLIDYMFFEKRGGTGPSAITSYRHLRVRTIPSARTQDGRLPGPSSVAAPFLRVHCRGRQGCLRGWGHGAPSLPTPLASSTVAPTEGHLLFKL